MSIKRDMKYTIIVHGSDRLTHAAIEEALVRLCDTIARTGAVDGCAYDVRVIRECEPGRPTTLTGACADLVALDDAPESKGPQGAN